MANSVQTKRKASSSKSLKTMNSRQCSPDFAYEITSSQRKRRRFSMSKPQNETSTDSFSYYNYDSSRSSEDSSDSEFEEHAYSRSPAHFKDVKGYSRSKPPSELRFQVSQVGTSSSANESRRSKCTSKNAVMARLNRLKKKRYIENLENKNAELEAENKMLKNMLDVRAKEVESLKRKTLNLESVIRNKTEIGSLLRCVRQHTDLDITSSLLKDPPNNSCIAEENTISEEPGSCDILQLDVSPSEKEALVAAVLWGMALHTFCQPYKPRTLTS